MNYMKVGKEEVKRIKKVSTRYLMTTHPLGSYRCYACA